MMARVRYFTTFKGEHVQTSAPMAWRDYEDVKNWRLSDDEPVTRMLDRGFGLTHSYTGPVAHVSHFLEIEPCAVVA